MKPFTNIKQVEKYAEIAKKAVGLSHWDIKFHEEGYNESAVAECRPEYKYQKANIDIFKHFYDCEIEYQEITIIHELLHCQTNFWKDVFDVNFIEHPDYADNQMATIKNMIIVREETSVELMARGIQKLINQLK